MPPDVLDVVFRRFEPRVNGHVVDNRVTIVNPSSGNAVTVVDLNTHIVRSSDPATNLPFYPEGFAEPAREPRFPQDFAEIMGGRIPLSPAEADIPRSLAVTLVGAATAQEIGWQKP